MKYFLILFLAVLFMGADARGQLPRHRYRRITHTEVDLLNSVVASLREKDTARYFNLFPPFDTLWHMVLHNPDHSPEVVKEMSILKEHPQSLIEFDPLYNHDIVGRFCAVLGKGEDSGIVWQSVVLQRYELQKQELTRNLEGYDRIAPERFRGFIFLRDLLGRRTFCVSITEIQKLKGDFFGGQVLNILEASSIDDYVMKEIRERKYFEWLAAHPDTTGTDSLGNKIDTAAKVTGIDEEEEKKKRKEVIDRKYYEGKFDNEIPVRLYVRYMKDVGGKVQSFDGLYKFGDQKKYVKLEVVKNEEGKWMMEDEVPLGIMELELKGKTYTGSWNNNDENGYDVVLNQTLIPQQKIELLDKILDQGASGRIDERVFQQPDSEDKQDKAEDRKDRQEDRKDKKEEQKDKKAQAKEKAKEETDDEWDRKQERAKDKERKKMKKLNRRRDDD